MNSSPIPQETKPTRLTRKSIAELVEAGKVEEAVDALRAGMKATRKFYSPITKSWVEEPDHRTRIDAARIVLAYAVGFCLANLSVCNVLLIGWIFSSFGVLGEFLRTVSALIL